MRNKITLMCIVLISACIGNYYYAIVGSMHTNNLVSPYPKKSLLEPTNPANAPVNMLFCHGVGGSSDCSQAFEHSLEIPLEVEALDFPGSSKRFDDRHPHLQQARMMANCCFAQENEIKCVTDHYLQLVNKGKKVMLFGFSNGAANIITTAGTHDLANAAALVIIAAYDNPIPLFQTLLGSSTQAAIKYLQCSSGYNPHGLRPDKVVHAIQKTIPVFIACSLEDTVVPAQGTIRLAQMLAKVGHPMVHLVVLNHGDHNSMFEGPDGPMLKNAFHAFLKKYGFQHLPCYATLYDIDKALVF